MSRTSTTTTCCCLLYVVQEGGARLRAHGLLHPLQQRPRWGGARFQKFSQEGAGGEVVEHFQVPGQGEEGGVLSHALPTVVRSSAHLGRPTKGDHLCRVLVHTRVDTTMALVSERGTGSHCHPPHHDGVILLLLAR